MMYKRIAPFMLGALAYASSSPTLDGQCVSGSDPACDDETSSLLQAKMPRRAAVAGKAQVKDRPDHKTFHVEDPDSKECARVTYEAKNVLPANAKAAGMEPPMQVATEEGMDPKLKILGLDFTGIWWMRDNPVPEELVSFAGAKVNASTYPVDFNMPNNLKGMWAWPDTTVGRSLCSYYSTYDPAEPTPVLFESDTLGEIETGLTDVPLVWVDSFPFHKIDEDQWLRPSYFQKGSLLPQTNYTLTRIVKGDGSPHPTYWPAFMKHMSENGVEGAQKMVSFNANNACMRKCQTTFSCSMCQMACR